MEERYVFEGASAEALHRCMDRAVMAALAGGTALEMNDVYQVLCAMRVESKELFPKECIGCIHLAVIRDPHAKEGEKIAYCKGVRLEKKRGDITREKCYTEAVKC